MKKSETLLSVASEHIAGFSDRGSFEPKNRDSEDFLDVSVESLERALSAAYDAGWKARSETVMPPNSFSERF